jgi:hypothetical protein
MLLLPLLLLLLLQDASQAASEEAAQQEDRALLQGKLSLNKRLEGCGVNPPVSPVNDYPL